MNSEEPAYLAHSQDLLLRPKEAAKQLGITTETLRQWVAKGVMDYVEVGPFRHKRYKQSHIDRQLRDSST